MDVPNKLADAMAELSRNKNPDKITVKDLTDACGISRQTFYYYFDDLSDLFDLINRRGLQKALKECSKASSAQKALEYYILDFLDYHDRMKRGLSGARREEHEEFIIVSARGFMDELLNRYPEVSKMCAEERTFLIDFFAYGVANLIIWRGGDKTLDIPGYCARIVELLESKLHVHEK